MDLDVLILAGCNCLNRMLSVKSWAALLTSGNGPLRVILGYGDKVGTDDQIGNRVARALAQRVAAGSRDWVRNWLEINQDEDFQYFGGWKAAALDNSGYWSLEASGGKLRIAGPA